MGGATGGGLGNNISQISGVSLVGETIKKIGGGAIGGLGGSVDAPDNSALIQSQEKQQEILDKKAAELNKQKQQKLKSTVDNANAMRRSQMSMSSLIKTSENGLLGSISKLGK